MTDQIETISTPTRAERGWHFPRGRAWALVSIFPLWIVAFVSLQLLAGTGGPPDTPKSLAEAVDQYRGVSTPGWIAWCLFGTGIVVLTSFAVLWLGRAVRGLPGGAIAAWLGAVALVCGLLESLAIYFPIGLKLSESIPPSYPPLIERFALDVANSKVWTNSLTYGLWAVAIGVAALILWRGKLLGRTALVVAVLAGVFTVMAVFTLTAPVLPALLLGVLGVALLRSRRTGSA